MKPHGLRRPSPDTGVGIVFGFLVLYLSLTEEWGWWVFGLYLVSLPVGLALWRAMNQRRPDAFGAN